MIIFKIIIIALMLHLNSENSMDKELKNIKTKIEQNYYKADIKEYKKALSKLDVLKKSEKTNWRNFYYAGFISLQLGKIYREKDSEEATKFFKQAIEDLKRANKLYRHAELLALVSSAYGKIASLSIFKAVWFGGHSDEFMKKAIEISDATVQEKLNLVEATHLMFTPEMFGGDKDKAEQLLLDALDVKQKNDQEFITWADKTEIYAYLAQLEFENENYSKAQEYCQVALEHEPDYSFVLNELYPEIKKKLGE